jgi:hypothetical protein
MIAVTPTISMGTAMAFSTTAAVTYKTANATNLPEPLTEDEISWFGTIMTRRVDYVIV